jgi:hypothetical protein
VNLPTGAVVMLYSWLYGVSKTDRGAHEARNMREENVRWRNGCYHLADMQHEPRHQNGARRTGAIGSAKHEYVARRAQAALLVWITLILVGASFWS